MEMKNFQACIEECDKAIEVSRGGYYDYVKLSKALARKANAYLGLGNFEKAIELF